MTVREHVYDASCAVCRNPHAEVDRLRSELFKANADTERLEAELAEARRQP